MEAGKSADFAPKSSQLPPSEAEEESLAELIQKITEDESPCETDFISL